MEQKRLRLDELSSLFAAANDEDYEDVDEIGVLPSVEVKSLKAKLKEAKAQCKLAKREKHDAEEFEALIRSVENRLISTRRFTDESETIEG